MKGRRVPTGEGCASICDAAEISAFRHELRFAREACLRDAEAFDEVLFVIERLGSRLLGQAMDLGSYKPCLAELASQSDLSPDFLGMFETVRVARNDALHHGSVARHLTVRVMELALILEDALASKLETVQHLMVQQPVVAYPWQTIAAIRQVMLSNAFSYLPIRWEGKWYLLADYRVAAFLRTASPPTDRRQTLAKTLKELVDRGTGIREKLLLDPGPNRCTRDVSPKDAAEKMWNKGTPVLVFDQDDNLVGLISPADLL